MVGRISRAKERSETVEVELVSVSDCEKVMSLLMDMSEMAIDGQTGAPLIDRTCRDSSSVNATAYVMVSITCWWLRDVQPTYQFGISIGCSYSSVLGHNS